MIDFNFIIICFKIGVMAVLGMVALVFGVFIAALPFTITMAVIERRKK